MADRWLLVAEADKIQDLVFRSARLAQVVGGSSLLAEFCATRADQIIAGFCADQRLPTGAVEKVIADGGAFRLIVAGDQAQARDLGERIANRYAAAVGGTMSVAEPVQLADGAGQYAVAAERGEENLRIAKRSGLPRSLDLMPLYAICEDCGRTPPAAWPAITPTKSRSAIYAPSVTRSAVSATPSPPTVASTGRSWPTS